MTILAAVIAAVAGIAWVVALVSWVMAVNRRKPEISLSSMLFSGLRAFDPANFTEAGRAHQRRFIVAFVVFFVTVIGGAAISAALS